MTNGRSQNDGREMVPCVALVFEGKQAKVLPFAERLSCTVDEACEATGLGRTKLYELIGAGQIITTTVGRRRLVVVRSLVALLRKAVSA